jgi:heme exporter protein C
MLPRSIQALTSPGKLRLLFDRLIPAAAVLCVLSLAFGVYSALFASPPDYQQGEAVRMMYVHVPAAWIALGAYVVMGLCGVAGIAGKLPSLFLLCRAVAVPGAVFCGLCLVTGSLWGYPVWGTWWAWDARLTSTLVLFFFYIAYLLLLRLHGNAEKAERFAASLCVLGLVNVPIVKFSVEWWNTLHQPASVLRKGGIAIDDAMLLPLLAMFLAYACFTATVAMIRYKTLLNDKKARRLENSRLRALHEQGQSP